MPITTSRRDILRFVGGSLAGLIFTPIPWKLLDDIAIRTQNPPWSVGTPRGDIIVKFSTCALCPSACGMRLRCIGNQPTSVAGVTHHPLSHGTLCPSGLGAQHIPYHPLRIVRPIKIARSGDSTTADQTTLDEVLAQLRSAIQDSRQDGSIAILDRRPGRTISALYRKFLAEVPNGQYLVAPGEGEFAFHALRTMLGTPSSQFGVDLEHTRTLISFGTPVLDGWASPGRIQSMIDSRESINEDSRLNFIQFESRQSRTAMRADRWIPIAPSSEAVVALGLAHVIIAEQLRDLATLSQHATDLRQYRQIVASFTPERVADIAGVPPQVLTAVARSIANRTPALAIGFGDPGNGPLGTEAEMAIGGLNLILGSVGTRGGIIARNEEPLGKSLSHSTLAPALEISSLPDKSIRVLIIDGTEGTKVLPWNLIEPKLVDKNSLIVTLTPFLSELARRSDYVIPTPTPLEYLTDIPTPGEAGSAIFALSAPLLEPPAGVVQTVNVLNQLFSGSESVEQQLKQKVEAIHNNRRGTIFKYNDGSTVETASISSSDDLWRMLIDGALWTDSPRRQSHPAHFTLLGTNKPNVFENIQSLPVATTSVNAGEGKVLLMPYGYSAAVGSGQLSPVLSKLYQESNLRRGHHWVSIHPSLGKSLGVEDGKKAILSTTKGVRDVIVHLDNGVMPGVAAVCVGPDPVDFFKNSTGLNDGFLDIVEVKGSTWNITSAILRKA
jgi:anaerobic selenocysteine-containing dehydrogenase